MRYTPPEVEKQPSRIEKILNLPPTELVPNAKNIKNFSTEELTNAASLLFDRLNKLAGRKKWSTEIKESEDYNRWVEIKNTIKERERFSEGMQTTADTLRKGMGEYEEGKKKAKFMAGMKQTADILRSGMEERRGEERRKADRALREKIMGGIRRRKNDNKEKEIELGDSDIIIDEPEIITPKNIPTRKRLSPITGGGFGGAATRELGREAKRPISNDVEVPTVKEIKPKISRGSSARKGLALGAAALVAGAIAGKGIETRRTPNTDRITTTQKFEPEIQDQAEESKGPEMTFTEQEVTEETGTKTSQPTSVTKRKPLFSPTGELTGDELHEQARKALQAELKTEGGNFVKGLGDEIVKEPVDLLGARHVRKTAGDQITRKGDEITATRSKTPKGGETIGMPMPDRPTFAGSIDEDLGEKTEVKVPWYKRIFGIKG